MDGCGRHSIWLLFIHVAAVQCVPQGLNFPPSPPPLHVSRCLPCAIFNRATPQAPPRLRNARGLQLSCCDSLSASSPDADPGVLASSWFPTASRLTQVPKGNAEVGVVSSLFWAVMWAVLYRFALPKMSRQLLDTPWGHSAVRQQRVMLSEIGFTGAAASVDSELTDVEVAGLSSWLCLTALVHVAAGALALPLALNGWGQCGTPCHLAFFMATWVMVGWCTFAALDETLRCFCFDQLGGASVSGLSNRSPRPFWALTCLMYYPFWLTLVLPMNEVGAGVESYHALACAMMLGGGVQIGCRQLALLLGAIGDRWLLSVQRAILVLNLAVVLVSRGLVFFPSTVECVAQLRRHVTPASGDAFLVAAVLTGFFNVAAVLDAIKGTMWCSSLGTPARAGPGNIHQSQPLREDDHGRAGRYDDSTAEDSTTPLGCEPEGAPARHRRVGRGQRSRQNRGGPRHASKGHRVSNEDDFADCDDEERAWRRRGASGLHADEDEEMTFGFGAGGAQCGGPASPATGDAHMGGDGSFDGFNKSRRSTKSHHRAGADTETHKRQHGYGSQQHDSEPQPPRPSQHPDSQRQASATAAATAEQKVAEAKPTAVDHSALLEQGRLSKVGHYALLGVAKQATDNDIKKAFFQLSRKWHPDKNPDDKDKADAIFRGIKEAYECLSDPVRRRRYDKFFSP